MFIAHFRSKDGAEQPLEKHLKETAEIAKENGSPLGIPTICYLAGILHDAGKYGSAFQDYIFAAKRGEKVERGSVDHSTYGGKMIRSLSASTKYEMMAMEMIANAIFAHHSPRGLLDFISGEEDEACSPFMNRYERTLEDLESVKELFFSEVLPLHKMNALLSETGKELERWAARFDRVSRTDQFFLMKMVYSALLDGDRRNTQQFEEGTAIREESNKELFLELSQKLEKTFDRFKKGNQTEINQLRQEMAEACLKAAERKTGIYTLSIPTGGGKTLSSMRFALNHAIFQEKRRIIYIIPFSSIIEQNAEVFRKELGDDNNDFILEHHSNLMIEEDDESEESERKQALMQDNWDSPIIVTTMVRFLENVFSGSTRNPRRVHQLLNSVLIFDEIQSLAPKCLSMFNSLINFLKNYGNTTTLLCTATQPTLGKRKLKLQIETDGEIVPNLLGVTQAFERVEIIDKTISEGWTTELLKDFAEEVMMEENNLLMIFNTKKAVREVYQLLQDSEFKTFHLSTSMTANHRSEILKKIRDALRDKQKIICVTTPLIEAGVDVSFSCVIRSVTGLDSIAQAAGRCNRNAESAGLQPVYLVNPVKQLENIDKMEEIKTKKELTTEILLDRKFNHDESSLLQPKFIERFFDKFYDRLERTHESEYLINQGSQSLFPMMQKNSNRKQAFQDCRKERVPTCLVSSTATIAKHFKVIDQIGESVLVEFGEGKELVADLVGSEEIIFDKRWYQKAQRNSLNLYQHEFQRLEREGMLEIYEPGVYVLHAQAYSNDFGLNIEGDSTVALNF
ncbi:CRISPR-associated helicase Cas3' [Candidatus Enterococcus murrayae]|uniref:CRISPR-associated helicase Cas3 n=1 Tax=Candidatus Enterococcus murrayae TaxID=2815321 RepID=A0ABS3HJ83_9ENTE|nr:CRISPR-associated helicase Cas3' [Enterococcus sp. MJM16]MBO0452613.1 CRISPR-associated helicase Cas3' [Enterococcus sp. MJM16]